MITAVTGILNRDQITVIADEKILPRKISHPAIVINAIPLLGKIRYFSDIARKNIFRFSKKPLYPPKRQPAENDQRIRIDKRDSPILLKSVNLHKNFCVFIRSKQLFDQIKIPLLSLKILTCKIGEIIRSIQEIPVSKPIIFLSVIFERIPFFQ